MNKKKSKLLLAFTIFSFLIVSGVFVACYIEPIGSAYEFTLIARNLSDDQAALASVAFEASRSNFLNTPEIKYTIEGNSGNGSYLLVSSDQVALALEALIFFREPCPFKDVLLLTGGIYQEITSEIYDRRDVYLAYPTEEALQTMYRAERLLEIFVGTAVMLNVDNVSDISTAISAPLDGDIFTFIFNIHIEGDYENTEEISRSVEELIYNTFRWTTEFHSVPHYDEFGFILIIGGQISGEPFGMGQMDCEGECPRK